MRSSIAMKASMKASMAALLLGVAAMSSAHADAVDSLKAFVRDVKSGRSDFTQTVTAPDGIKKKTSSGTFEFARPNRFRFTYVKPFEQVIVADGQKVWIYDPDLNQVSSRKLTQALGATPAALLAGGSMEKDFDLKAMPDRDGLSWAQALPHTKDGAFQSLQVGFDGSKLAAVEIVDSFGQKSLLKFDQLAENAAVPAASFMFKPPAGADVLEQ
ncbi:MAG: outer rane lipoprotein carrier protein LolA [Rhizobacter sp.]|nr:outer rane lipoprotein carrier protein LolA [Rhizobacter sp.]